MRATIPHVKPLTALQKVLASAVDKVSLYVFLPTSRSCTHCQVAGYVCRGRVTASGRSFMEYNCGHCQHMWRIAATGERRERPRPMPVARH